MKVRITGKGKGRNKVIRLTATKGEDCRTLMNLIEALAAPPPVKDPK